MMGSTPVQRQMPISPYLPITRYSDQKAGQKLKEIYSQSDLHFKDNDFLNYIGKIEKWLKRHPDKIKSLYTGLGVKEVIESRGSKQRQILMARYGTKFLDTVVSYLKNKYRPMGLEEYC